MMRALVVGNGAREHIIAEKLSESSEVYAFMSRRNPGISRICRDFRLGSLTDFESIRRFSENIAPDFVFVGPEEPLVNGISDVIKNVIGPNKSLARLEGDKSFCRNFLRERIGYGYPRYMVCDSYEEAVQAIEDIGDVVVKPAGLTAGKGVRVLGQQLRDQREAKEYARELLDKRLGGMNTVVIEERIDGEEFTLQAFCDGDHLFPMPVVQDHKYAYEGDRGPMTGGMGSYSSEDHLLPFLEGEEVNEARGIMKKTVEELRKDGERYRGVLYGGFMLGSAGVKLLEYNVRFGDPEAMNVLSLLKGDLSELCVRILEGDLKRVEFEDMATVCKYLVPRGYPDNPEKGVEITVNEPVGTKLYYASVEESDGKTYISGSRALAVLGKGGTIEEAERIAEEGAYEIKTNGLWYRSDIGKKELIERRVQHISGLKRQSL